MIDMPDRPRDPFTCVRCGMTIHDERRYVFCSQECQDLDVPDQPGIGGVRVPR